MNPVVTAERTLFWAGLALVVALALVEASRRDLRRAKDDLRAERDRRADLQEDVDRLRGDLDGALEHIHKLSADPPPEP
jgi:hypothetical protein